MEYDNNCLSVEMIIFTRIQKYINLLVLQPYYLQFSFSNYKQMYNIIEQSTCGYLTREGGGRMPDGLKLTCTIILPLIQNDSF